MPADEPSRRASSACPGPGAKAERRCSYGARLDLPYPEVAVIEEDTLQAQNLAVAAALPERPLILGGCCCSHVGAVEALAARHGRVAVVWLDAHGDLNTPETSPSGNVWGMPLRMLIDSETVRPHDVVLIGARTLDPPEEAVHRRGRHAPGVEELLAAIDGADAVYVALDVDVLDPARKWSCSCPSPTGRRPTRSASILERIAPPARRVRGLRR